MGHIRYPNKLKFELAGPCLEVENSWSFQVKQPNKWRDCVPIKYFNNKILQVWIWLWLEIQYGRQSVILYILGWGLPTVFWCIPLKLAGSIYLYTWIPGGNFQFDPNSKKTASHQRFKAHEHLPNIAPSTYGFHFAFYTIMYHSHLIGRLVWGPCYTSCLLMIVKFLVSVQNTW